MEKEVRSEKDFEWRVKPRCILRSDDDDIFVEVLHLRRTYGYEHLGDCPHPVYTAPMRHQMLTFLASFKLKQFPMLRGPESPAPSPGCGKLSLAREVARTLGILFVVRSVATHFDKSVLLQYLQGVAYSGAWLCIHGVDRLQESTLSALAPYLNDLKSALLHTEELADANPQTETSKLRTTDALLGGRLKVKVDPGGFLCFTSAAASLSGGRDSIGKLPLNFRVTPL